MAGSPFDRLVGHKMTLGPNPNGPQHRTAAQREKHQRRQPHNTRQTATSPKSRSSLHVITHTLSVFELGKADKIALRALFTDSELVKMTATSASNVTVTVGAVLANLLGFAFE